jgi:hypothetical protein
MAAGINPDFFRRVQIHGFSLPGFTSSALAGIFSDQPAGKNRLRMTLAVIPKTIERGSVDKSLIINEKRHIISDIR